MFHSVTLKLTLWYLALIMILSGLFSLALYNESIGQLQTNVQHQENAIDRLPLPPSMETRRDDYKQYIEDQFTAAQNEIGIRLLGLNLITLILGGALSYYLARRTLRPIEEAMEAQGRFTADASHELRTPLTAMRTEIEVSLRDTKLGIGEARELLASNLEEIAKLEALSAGLLRLAQFGHGLDPALVKPVAVRAVFTEVAKRFATQLEARHIALEQTVGDETIEGDHTSLTELIAILVDNAIKYSPEGSQITLKSHKSGQTVSLSVADQGAGIKATDIPRIFDRFYRADRSRTKTKEQINGYGLGLSIAQRIAHLHHATITVASKLEQGSTFTIKLPAEYKVKQRII